MNLPTGTGKSAILRAIQLEFPNTAGIVPSNILLDQYKTTYESLNYLKGIANYSCHEQVDYSCQDMKNIDKKPCENCPYQSSRKRALNESTVFNPISYYYFTRMRNFERGKILVIDEAHKLINTLMLLVDISFRKGKYDYPKITNEVELLNWLNVLHANLHILAQRYKKSGDASKVIEYTRHIEKLNFLIKSFTEKPQDFVFYEQEATYRNTTDMYLCIKPIKPPKWLLDSIFEGFEKIILMSATLTIDDLWEMNIKDYVYIDMPSPIPKESRQIKYIPSGHQMNYKTEPSDVAAYIKKQLAKYPVQNTVVHVSYGWAKKLRPFFPDAIFNTPEDKDKVLVQFKKTGGLWIAAGCSEGLDLPGDECRLTIVPFIILGNPTDPLIAKQLSVPGGRLRYELNAIKTVIQQVGRSTRGEEDFSVSIIGDNKFPNLIVKNKKFIPISFTEAIVWSNNDNT